MVVIVNGRSFKIAAIDAYMASVLFNSAHSDSIFQGLTEKEKALPLLIIDLMLHGY